MEKEPELLKTFPKTNREAWKEKVIQDLKGADFDKKLVWRTYEGIPVQPFYTPEDTEKNALLKAQHHLLSKHSQEWVNYVEISATDERAANSAAVKMLDFAATGFLFDLADQDLVDFETLLSGIPLSRVHVAFHANTPRAHLLKRYFEYCTSQGVALDHLQGFYEADVLENHLINGNPADFDAFAELVQVSLQAPGFYGLVVGSHAFVNAGASSSQETGFLLSKVVEYITRLVDAGLSIQDIWNNVQLHTAIGGDYFFELAKLRALRVLVKSIAEVYHVTDPVIRILASSSLWSKSLFDPHVNMLRNTTEAMSAILGGSDAILIRPHDSTYKTPTDFSRRIALNISNLLKEESYLDKVADPAGGSYYLETLTADLSTRALRFFQETESSGGFMSAFKAGVITATIREVRDQKEKDVASRKQVFVGTNKYPNLGEKAEGTLIDSAPQPLLLSPQRATRAFDNLRLKTQLHFEETGFIPKVYLACFGNLAMRKARATFSAEFFGTAGFEILGEFAFKDAATAAAEAASSPADLVVICSSDQEYEADAANFARSFKAKAGDKLLVLAGFPAEIIELLKASGVDAFIHLKTNAIEALTGFQNQLFQLSKISES